MDDIIYRYDGWYWIDSYGYLIGPYETRGEAARGLASDQEYESDWYISDQE